MPQSGIAIATGLAPYDINATEVFTGVIDMGTYHNVFFTIVTSAFKNSQNLNIELYYCEADGTIKSTFYQFAPIDQAQGENKLFYFALDDRWLDTNERYVKLGIHADDNQAGYVAIAAVGIPHWSSLPDNPAAVNLHDLIV